VKKNRFRRYFELAKMLYAGGECIHLPSPPIWIRHYVRLFEYIGGNQEFNANMSARAAAGGGGDGAFDAAAAATWFDDGLQGL